MSPIAAIIVFGSEASAAGLVAGCGIRLEAAEVGDDAVDAVRHQAGVVQVADRLGEAPAPRGPGRRRELEDLIPDRVHDDARVVQVLRDEGVDVVPPSCREARSRVEGDLRAGPGVGELVHHEDAVPVARVEHRAAHGVVRAAQRVEARLLEEAHAAVLGVGERGRPERSAVVVHAGAPQLHGLAVDPQSAPRIDLQATDAEGRGIRVDHVSVLVGEARAHAVERRASRRSRARVRRRRGARAPPPRSRGAPSPAPCPTRRRSRPAPAPSR